MPTAAFTFVTFTVPRVDVTEATMATCWACLVDEYGAWLRLHEYEGVTPPSHGTHGGVVPREVGGVEQRPGAAPLSWQA